MKGFNPEEEGKIASHSQGLGTVTERMIEKRAEEIALINGRSPKHVQPTDVEQARRELLGEERLSPRENFVETVHESERWREVGYGAGHRAPKTEAHDEQTDSEKAYEEGVGEAEHDQMVQATKEGLRKDTGH